jgi:hypothetical protein
MVDTRTRVFPLAEAANAHRRAQNGRVGGQDSLVESCDFAAFDGSFTSDLARQWVRPGPV